MHHQPAGLRRRSIALASLATVVAAALPGAAIAQKK